MPQTKLHNHYKSCKIRKCIFGGDINGKTEGETEYNMLYKTHIHK